MIPIQLALLEVLVTERGADCTVEHVINDVQFCLHSSNVMTCVDLMNALQSIIH